MAHYCLVKIENHEITDSWTPSNFAPSFAKSEWGLSSETIEKINAMDDGFYRIHVHVAKCKTMFASVKKIALKKEYARLSKKEENTTRPTDSMPGYLRTRYSGLDSAADSKRHQMKLQAKWIEEHL